LNGHPSDRIRSNVNISFEGVEGESLMMGLNDTAVSSGISLSLSIYICVCVCVCSACTSESLEPSHVLHAMGLPPELSHTSIRFGVGRFTTEKDVREVVNRVRNEVQRLRSMSPLWEMLEMLFTKTTG
ncbi:hypothetical protein KIPB_010857, partial [Kipferlia bialata]